MRITKQRGEGAQYSEDADGEKIVESFRVDQIEGGSYAVRLRNVRRNAFFPIIGAPHEEVDGIQLLSVTVEALNVDATVCDVLLTWGVPASEAQLGDQGGETGSGAVEFAAESVQDERNTDVFGEPLITEYQGTFDPNDLIEGNSPGEGFAVVRLHRRTHTVEYEKSILTVRLRRRESRVPRDEAIEFHNKTNSRDWSGFPPFTWLCRGITSSDNGDGTHDVTYYFSYKPETWQVELRIKLLGFFPPDGGVNNGISYRHIYESVDFNRLGVSF